MLQPSFYKSLIHLHMQQVKNNTETKLQRKKLHVHSLFKMFLYNPFGNCQFKWIVYIHTHASNIPKLTVFLLFFFMSVDPPGLSLSLTGKHNTFSYPDIGCVVHR